MKVVTVQVIARFSCRIDAQVARAKDQTVTEYLRDLLRDSCFHLEEIKVLEPDCGTIPASMVGYITVLSDGPFPSAKREFEEIVRYVRDKTKWKLEKYQWAPIEQI